MVEQPMTLISYRRLEMLFSEGDCKITNKLTRLFIFLFLFLGVIDITPTQASTLPILPIVKQYTPSGKVHLSSVNITIVPTTANRELQKIMLTLKEDLDALGYTTRINAHSVAGQNVIKLEQANSAALSKHPNRKQAYILEIKGSDHLNAKIIATNRDGMFFGTRSLLQLLAIAKNSHKLQIPAGTIVDYPSFKERSVMIDVGRRYFKMATLEKYIRLMGYYKMNMLHIHFTDYPAFRLKDDPNGPYVGLASQKSYSHADINRLRDYATKYHIQILPEIDVPAHASAIAAYYRRTHPGKAIDFDAIIQKVPACADMNALDPSLKFMLPTIPMFTLNVANPDTVPFIEGIISHFMRWFKKDADHPEQGQFFSIGADEIPNNQSMLKCMNGMHEYAKANPAYKDYDNWYKLCYTEDGKLTNTCKGDPNSPLYSVLPGGIYVENFINKINQDLFQKDEKNQGMKMRIWTGWNASNYAKVPGGPWKYSASPIDPDNDIHLDSWLVNKNLNDFLDKGYSITNTSYQMTYLIPGSSNQFWHYPYPQDYQARTWIPITYQAKGGVVNVDNRNYDNFFGAGLQIWSDGQIAQMSDDYYYTVSQRAIMLMANNVWAGNHWRRAAPGKANLPFLAANMAKIGLPPQDSAIQNTTPKYCVSLASLRQSNTRLYTLPIPWTMSFNMKRTEIKDHVLYPVVQILDKSRTLKDIEKELKRDDYAQHDLPLVPQFKQNYLPFVAIILKKTENGVYVGYYNGVTGWEASHVVKNCGYNSHCKPPLGTFILRKPIKPGGLVKLVGDITGVKAIIDGKTYPINDSVMSLPLRHLNTSIATDVKVCNFAQEEL